MTKDTFINLPYTHGIYTVDVKPAVKDDWPTEVYQVNNTQTGVMETQTPSLLEAIQFAIFQNDALVQLVQTYKQSDPKDASESPSVSSFVKNINPDKLN